MSLHFRLANTADVPQLAAMNSQLIRDEGHRNTMTRAELERRMAGWLTGEYEAVLFELNGRPVGYALYRREPDHVYLRQFYITAEHRRQGIGRTAIDSLQRSIWVDVTRIRLDVLVGNEIGIAFWRSVGFRDYCLTMELDARTAGAELALQTERLLLRRITYDDFEALLAVLGDPQTMIYHPRPHDLDSMQLWIDRELESYGTNGFGRYAVVLKDTGEVIGDCGLKVQDVDGKEEVELGYHIAHHHWNRGYATEAVRACRDEAFGRLGLTRLISLIRPENLPSRRVAEKIGLAIEREIEWAGLRHLVYAITATVRR